PVCQGFPWHQQWPSAMAPLRTAIVDAMENPDKLVHMAKQTNGLVPTNAANAIVDLIEEQLADAKLGA
ncbi:MAG: hypothetical protein AAFR69_12495, partial [Pseudomonadota bacterium]